MGQRSIRERTGPPSRKEIMVIVASRELRDGDVVVVGLGLPQVAAMLAQRTHAPNLHMVLEIGVIDPQPVDPAVGIADPRIWYRASSFCGFVDTLGTLLPKGAVDVGFLGGLEVDKYGNINSSLTLEAPGKSRHFTGSGGANDIASMANRTIIMMPQQKRKFPERVTFVTCPGYEGGSGKRWGLKGGGPWRVITDMAVFGFSDGQMELLSVHPGVTVEDVLAEMQFTPKMPERVPVTSVGSAEELRLIREVIDPDGLYTA
ncbi:MAG: CoA-transferase subunit beta [Bacillota bacterium]